MAVTTQSAAKRERLQLIVRPFARFAQVESAGGLLLLGCTVLAMVWANSPWRHSYHAFWETQSGLQLGGIDVVKDLGHWVKDGLMAVFFFVVGLEIKREILVGELATIRRAALPVIAAIGGMLIPAALYTAVNFGHPGQHGWGIPMATDIAFSLGVLSLLGRSVPVSLKVFLTAPAIADNIGAVLVIAIFYSHGLHWGALGAAAIVLLLFGVMNWLGVRRPAVYAILAILLWAAFLESGIHATVAGVLAAMLVPTWSHIDAPSFLERCRSLLQTFDEADDRHRSLLTNETQLAAVPRDSRGLVLRRATNCPPGGRADRQRVEASAAAIPQ